MTCVVCDRRPARNGCFCTNCGQKIEAGKRRTKASQPVKYATYQGHVIGFFRNGGKGLVARLLKRKPENLPKGITIDLNVYVDGFSRVQVKKIKAAISSLTQS